MLRYNHRLQMSICNSQFFTKDCLLEFRVRETINIQQYTWSVPHKPILCRFKETLWSSKGLATSTPAKDLFWKALLEKFDLHGDLFVDSRPDNPNGVICIQKGSKCLQERPCVTEMSGQILRQGFFFSRTILCRENLSLNIFVQDRTILRCYILPYKWS